MDALVGYLRERRIGPAPVAAWCGDRARGAALIGV
jgi:hypothetical protein